MGSDYNTAGAVNPYDAFSNFLTRSPEATAQQANTIPTIASAELQAARQTTPGYNQLNLNQLRQYALPEAQVDGYVLERHSAFFATKGRLYQDRLPEGVYWHVVPIRGKCSA